MHSEINYYKDVSLSPVKEIQHIFQPLTVVGKYLKLQFYHACIGWRECPFAYPGVLGNLDSVTENQRTNFEDFGIKLNIPRI
jgi:hypothetical protein